MDAILKKARKESGLAKYERKNPKYKIPGTIEAGRWSVLWEETNRIRRRLENAEAVRMFPKNPVARMDEALTLKNERMTFSEWRVGRNGQMLLDKNTPVVMNCIGGAKAFGILYGFNDAEFFVDFPDGETIMLNAYEAWLRDLRPA